MLVVRRLETEHESAWNRVVETTSGGTFFHLADWREVLTRGAGIETHYLWAERNGEMVGVLPLAHLRSHLFGHALVSTPFCVRGGAVAVDAEVIRRLEDAAVALADELRVRRLELRNAVSTRPDWPAVEHYCSFRKALEPSVDANLEAIPRKQRAVVRQALAGSLAVEVGPELRRFYRVFATSVRNLGSPVYSRRYFEALLDVFGDRAEITLVRHDDRDVAGVLSFYFKDEVLPYYGGGLPAARPLKAYDFMYWDLMRRAVERGLGVFDFGRSIRGTGSFAFKKNWGFEPAPLCYEYRLRRGAALPDNDPTHRTNRFLMSVWRRLPLVLANRLGPLISRQFT